MKAQHAARVEQARKRLAAIDPRLAVPPAPNPFLGMLADGEPSLDALLATAENHDEPQQRRVSALQAVGSVFSDAPSDDGPEAHIGGRLQRLSTQGDAPPAVRAAATRALIAGRDPGVMAVCEQQLSSDSPVLVAAAAHAMGVARQRSAVAALVRLLAQEHEQVVLAEAAWALGEIGGEGGLRALVTVFDRAGGMPPVPVIEALGKLGTLDTLEMLLTHIGQGTAVLRLAMVEAIATLIERHDTDDLARARSALAVAVEHERDPLVAVLILTAMRRAGAEISEDAIRAVLARSPGRPTLHAYVRSVFRRAVRAIRPPAPAGRRRGPRLMADG